MKRVLIIGGAGFIGSHLARHCINGGDEVHVLARPQTDLARLAGIAGDVGIHRLELADNAALAACFAHLLPHEVYHLASRTRWQQATNLLDARESVATEILNLTAILAATASTKSPPKAVVRTGSLAEYGNGPAPYLESQRENPLNAYSAALVAATHCAQMLQRRLSFPVLTARLALTYGPRQDEGFLMPTLVRNCLAGQATNIARPDDCRDLIYVTDVAEALCRLARTSVPAGAIVNISTGLAPPVREIARQVASATGASQDLIKISEPSATDLASDSCLNFCGSPLLARKLLDWEAGIDLNEGLRLLLEAGQNQNTSRKEPE